MLKKSILAVCASLAVAGTALADKPRFQAPPPPAAVGTGFQSGGTDWQVAPDRAAVPGDKQGFAAEGIAQVAGWTILPQAGNGFAGETRPVAWDSLRQRYGILTGEVVAFLAAGQAAPRENLPTGLSFSAEYPKQGLAFYRLAGSDLAPVAKLTAMPGILRAEPVVQTSLARPN